MLHHILAAADNDQVRIDIAKSFQQQIDALIYCQVAAVHKTDFASKISFDFLRDSRFDRRFRSDVGNEVALLAIGVSSDHL